MVVKWAYGQLKGRWRLLLRKSEGNLYHTKMATLSCTVIHKICLLSDVIPAKPDLCFDPITQQRRDRAIMNDILLMKSSLKVAETKQNAANKLRKTIKMKLQKGLEFIKQNS